MGIIPMTRNDIYDAWIIAGGQWTKWAKPVALADIPDSLVSELRAMPFPAVDVSWAPLPRSRTVLIVDLRGPDSVEVGIALTKRGYRPVPLFNASTGANEAVDQSGIRERMCRLAAILASASLPADAPPAFLLDALRLTPQRALRPGVFDNRWKVDPDDLPRAGTLQERKFAGALLVQRTKRCQVDIAAVLFVWQKEGIEVKVYNAATHDVRNLEQPGWWKQWWYALKTLSLRRNPERGFGEVIRQSHG
jgi:hypothetical protein